MRARSPAALRKAARSLGLEPGANQGKKTVTFAFEKDPSVLGDGTEVEAEKLGTVCSGRGGWLETSQEGRFLLLLYVLALRILLCG